MAEENDNDNHFSLEDLDNRESSTGIRGDDDDDDEDAATAYSRNDEQAVENSSNSVDIGVKREENPFSFKKFLNQDTINHKHQLPRRKDYPTDLPSNENPAENHSYNISGMNNNPKILNHNEMASVLPDFVQDHLVIEQCYLNSSTPSVNIENINLHNLLDLNVEHQHIDFDADCSQRYDPVQHSVSSAVSNLPDFASVGQYSVKSDLESGFSSKTSPDFTASTSDNVSVTLGNEFLITALRDKLNRKTNVPRNCGPWESSQQGKSSVHMPSAANSLDLPYERAETVANSNGTVEEPIPFDLTVAAEDRSAPYRGISSTETVSKSLPDFLSDGPIQNDRLGENMQLRNLVSSLHDSSDQRILSPECHDRVEQNRYKRELDMLRRQLSQKNRRIHMLESQIEELESREVTDSSTLQYALHQLERNLEQTMKRASNVENALLECRQENSRLKAEISTLRSKNSNQRAECCDVSESASGPSSSVNSSQRIANELRIAANTAEASLRSLLTGIDNLRVIAASVESMRNFDEKTDEPKDFSNQEDSSASGPAQ